jgi:uncharacterized protein (DUF983 family)
VKVEPIHGGGGGGSGGRPIGRSIWRGFRCRCPACGIGALFDGYVTVVPACPVCGADMTPQRADDLPAYLTIVAVGHVIVTGMLAMEKAWHPEIWVHLTLWLPLTLGLAITLLRPIKGAVIGLQWGARMHGFGRDEIGG